MQKHMIYVQITDHWHIHRAEDTDRLVVAAVDVENVPSIWIYLLAIGWNVVYQLDWMEFNHQNRKKWGKVRNQDVSVEMIIKLFRLNSNFT